MRELRTAVIAAIGLTLVFGLAYPLAMTGVAQVVFPDKADGDPTLIAKDYSKDASLFQSRPSVTGYAADATFFNNQGPNQQALADQLKGYMDDYLKREQPFTPDLDRRRRPAGRGDDLGVGRRPAHLVRQRAHPGQPRRRRARHAARRRCSSWWTTRRAGRCSGSAGRSP